MEEKPHFSIIIRNLTGRQILYQTNPQKKEIVNHNNLIKLNDTTNITIKVSDSLIRFLYDSFQNTFTVLDPNRQVKLLQSSDQSFDFQLGEYNSAYS